MAALTGEPDRAEMLAGTISDPDARTRALAELTDAAAQAGALDRARRLMAMALAVDSPEVIGWAETLSRHFPEVIADAGDVFLGAYAR